MDECFTPKRFFKFLNTIPVKQSYGKKLILIKPSHYIADVPDLVMDIHKFKESIKVESHPLHHLQCSYEEGCLAPDAVFGRTSRYNERYLLKFTSRFINKGAVSFRPNLDKASWEYHKCHEHFHSMETFAIYDLIGMY